MRHFLAVSDTLWNVRFPQSLGGIPVRYAQLVAVINHGNLVMLGTETWGNVNVDTRPRISEAQAIDLGFAFAGGRTAADELWTKPSLEIIPVAPQELKATLKQSMASGMASNPSFRR